jgi:hypothetical protein
MTVIKLEDDYTIQALMAPMSEWEGLLDRMHAQQRGEVVNSMDALIQKATRLRGYADQRAGSDRGHAAGVVEANKLLAKVRKALGFTYPATAAVRF